MRVATVRAQALSVSDDSDDVALVAGVVVVVVQTAAWCPVWCSVVSRASC